jgi:gamma-glutamylcyclotransferase (GGCT)/AIG2-like uncharacterized protein YtfP
MSGSSDGSFTRAARRCCNPEEQLVVYGSLAPGGLYHFLLADLPGTWEQCVIRGRMERYGGFKALRYDAAGPEHPAWLFSSAELPRVISELDDFEGDTYERLVIRVRVGGRWVMAQVYAGKDIA